MTEHAVVIAGGGPTGLMLAAELQLGGVNAVVVERRPTQHLENARAGGLHARTIEVLDQRGVADRFLDAGQVAQIQSFAGVLLDISDLPSRHAHGLALWQRDFERILAGWIDELGISVLRGRDVVGVEQDDRGVDVALADGRNLRARYVVGCDGGRSVVRKAAGIDFPGSAPTASWIIAEADLDEEPAIGVRPEGGGIGPVDRVNGGSPYGIVLKDACVEANEPTVDDLRRALVAAYGTDYGLREPNYLSRFTDAIRQAASYRAGRVLVAGDAAHVHPPQGGQGLNTGVQDAVNLGWKLAQVVRGTSPEALLDTYHAERHPVAARVAKIPMAFVALGTQDDRHAALRETVAEIVELDDARRHLGARLSGLDIHYDLGMEHPLVGRRVPDLDLRTAAGETRVFALLHDARPVLLGLSGTGGLDLTPWADRVRRVGATCDADWELPVLGAIPAPAAVLIRPDGHVAWAGDLSDPALPDALTTWFGAPAAVSS